MANISDFSPVSFDGEKISMRKYLGKVSLIVNTESKCGFTYQYQGLQKLYDTYNEKGLITLCFPCNQFMNQEPYNETGIKQFYDENYNVTFPMFQKIKVNRPNTFPLFKYLKEKVPGLLGMRRIFWKFTKFQVNRNGNVIRRYQPSTEPASLSDAIVDLM